MATAKKNLTRKEAAFLKRNRATPAEQRIWRIIRDLYAKTETAVASAAIREETETHRTGLRWHLNNMIDKGLITKPSHKFYLPVLAD